MDWLFVNMDFLFKHLAPWPRMIPARFAVQNIGYMARKEEEVRRIFHTCNFSFILRGKGFYRRGHQSWEVQAPAVIIQIPGEDLHYGPGPGGWWEELFVIFAAIDLSEFIRSGLLNPAAPVWSVRHPKLLREQLRALNHLCQRAEEPGAADRIDRLAEAMIFESRIGLNSGPTTPHHPAISQVELELTEIFSRPIDWNEIARKHGLSLSSFRRHWLAQMGLPPAQFLRSLRLREARRLLAESQFPVGEIALRCGFADPLYFSRAFHQEIGQSAREYRKTHQVQNLPSEKANAAQFRTSLGE